MRYHHGLYLVAALAGLHAPLYATVAILSLTPSVSSPEPLGTPVTWTATATDSGPNQLVFQFSVALGKTFFVKQDFNAGTNNAGVWTSQPFVWTSIQSEGAYQIQVVAKDFTSGETATQTAVFDLTTRLSRKSAAVNATGNPLVALFSAPPCPVGSQMRATFQRAAGTGNSVTDWKPCNGTRSMNFYVAGMYPQTTYNMNFQVDTGGTITSGRNTLSFTTGPLPSSIKFPSFKVTVPAGPQADLAQRILLHSLIPIGAGAVYPPVATDITGRIQWYYGNVADKPLVTRPQSNETLLTIQDGTAWQSISTEQQLIRVIDLAGNIQRETNTGIVQQQLVAMGATDARPCAAIQQPAPVGAACLGAFHHEVIGLTNGDLVAFADIEKIFPAGTQGDASSLPVDIMGDMLIVLNSNMQVIWYWDPFQHDGGGTQLDINRAPTLGETCAASQPGCPPIFLLGPGIAPLAHDWMHSNSIYYSAPSGDFVVSIRHQDWIIKVDYAGGTGDVLWRLGLGGDFTFNNINNDSYPWFSHQHDAGITNQGTGPLTVFDNGNTRVASQGGGNSRGMVLTVDEASMTVTPVLSQDLGVYGNALGAAQSLSNGNYFFQPGLVNGRFSFNEEILPTSGTVNGSIVDDFQGPVSYRSFRQADLYHPTN